MLLYAGIYKEEKLSLKWALFLNAGAVAAGAC